MYRGTDHWIGGVASGIAQRFNLSPILIRGIFVALTCLAGLGLLVYGIAWALMPDERGTIHAQQAIAGRWSNGMSGALVFFVFGSIGFPAFFSWWDGGFWTFLVIAAIIFVLFSRRGRFANAGEQEKNAGNFWNAEQNPNPWSAPATAPDQASYAQPTEPAQNAHATSSVSSASGYEANTSNVAPQAAAKTTSDTNLTDSGTEILQFSAEFARSNASMPSNSTPAHDETMALPEAEDGNQDSVELPNTSEGPEDSESEPTARFQPLNQEPTMPYTSTNSPQDPTLTSALPRLDPNFSEPGPSATPGFTPPPAPGTAVKRQHNKSLPGYAATIIMGLAVVVFALIVGLNQLNMLEVPTSAVAIALAATLVIIALGIIGAALNQRTGGALIGFGIAALVLSLIFSGGALRGPNLSMFSNGVTTVDDSGTTNVFHSGTMDLLHYSTITQDTTVSVDNVFTSLKMIVPDNIPVMLQSDGAFSSLKIDGSSSSISGGNTRINPSATGPTLYLDLDGAFNSVEVSVQKAEVAP